MDHKSEQRCNQCGRAQDEFENIESELSQSLAREQRYLDVLRELGDVLEQAHEHLPAGGIIPSLEETWAAEIWGQDVLIAAQGKLRDALNMRDGTVE